MRYGIHIGLNKVSPGGYGGWDGILKGCINDAYYMQSLINANTQYLLVDEAATIRNLSDYIAQVASKTTTADTTFITYSGHGGQLDDFSADEADNLDETLCMYDGQLLDDDFLMLIRQLSGKVIVVSDSCHSGTITKSKLGLTSSNLRTKQKPKEVDAICQRIFRPKKFNYPNILTLSACQDYQVAYDGDSNGAFTKAIMDCRTVGREFNYIDLITRLRKKLGTMQCPKLTFSNGKSIIYNKIF